MPGSYWKDRFSEKQLERKRLGDKISQRRTRQQSKRTISELERRLELLSKGQTANLINQIQQENALLRTRIWRYRYQVESIFVKGKESMLQDDPSWVDLNTSLLTQSPAQSARQNNVTTLSITFRDDTSESGRSIEKAYWARHLKHESSVFRELGLLLGCTSSTHMGPASNEILESIMVWKAKFSRESDEFAVLLIAHGLGQEPYNINLEDIKQQALSKHLFQDIMQNLLYGEQLIPRNLQPKDKIPEEQMPKLEYQRRAIAYCVYEMIRAWRGHFKTSLEYLAAFWAQYRYFMLITFPTTENYEKCPTWRRPVIEQFGHDHPVVIDFILWPQIRGKLVSTWSQYDLYKLCVSITRSLVFLEHRIDIASVLRLQEDSSDLVLEQSFELALHDVRSFTAVGQFFFERYPELASTLSMVDVELPSLVPGLQLAVHPNENVATLEDQTRSTELSGYPSATSDPETVEHANFFDPSFDPNYVPSIEVPDLGSDCSNAPTDPIHWWNENLGDQQFYDVSLDLGAQWDDAGSFPSSLTLVDMGITEEPDQW